MRSVRCVAASADLFPMYERFRGLYERLDALRKRSEMQRAVDEVHLRVEQEAEGNVELCSQKGRCSPTTTKKPIVALNCVAPRLVGLLARMFARPMR